MYDLVLHIWVRLMGVFGLGFIALTSLTEFGQNIINTAHEMWSAVFDITLPGSDATVGDWMVIFGVSYFLTVIFAAYALKLVIMATKKVWGLIPTVGGV